MKKLLKIIGFTCEGFVFFIIAYTLFHYKLTVYGIEQAQGQIEIIRHAEPLEKILSDKSFPDSLKKKLKLIQEIKKFCFDDLELNYSENYSTVYNQNNKPVLWNVTACEPFRMKPYEWTFPFLGTVSYKGFFNKGRAKKEADELRAKNFDVYSYSVSGWSTLGWFKDPILSNMLKRSEGDLANLIIHELTHGTLYVKNSVNFNENLASFVGDKGAKMFLEKKYGINSPQLKKYLDDKSDDSLFDKYCLKYSAALDSLYNSRSTDKQKQKEKIISDFISGIDSLNFKNISVFHSYGKQAKESGNAFFMSFVRYESRQEFFEKELRQNFNSDIKKYIAHLKKIYPSL